MSQDEIQAFLDEMQKKRGYTLEMHRIMAHADLPWLKAYTVFLDIGPESGLHRDL